MKPHALAYEGHTLTIDLDHLIATRPYRDGKGNIGVMLYFLFRDTPVTFGTWVLDEQAEEARFKKEVIDPLEAAWVGDFVEIPEQLLTSST